MSEQQTLNKWLSKPSVKKRSRASIYDFDGTLFRSPDREKGEALYFEATGNLWPFSGWWGRVETLLPPLVPDPIPEEMWIPEVLEAYRADRAREDTNNYLMTGRPAKIRHRVQEILAVKQLIFDEYYYRGMKGHPQHGDTFEIKISLTESQIIHPELEVLEIWEDRPEHTSRFYMMAKRWKGRYKHLKKVIVHDVLMAKENEF